MAVVARNRHSVPCELAGQQRLNTRLQSTQAAVVAKNATVDSSPLVVNKFSTLIWAMRPTVT
ncbi:MAG: hypothetical protein KJ614_04670 [Gammaproteobacteria bacterium]|uniref:hypothetical protein n=1 Tax=Rhodoferax sp. TaxID=50421 RepID=UPI0017A8EEDC|nr:hypothetical protein [Rhodoferax sp.]MBU3898213.1 hypothetical protein [Gammaproteobacteria bacterium]MBA3057108.1 hypothetical protein [Rhodoferax sp.]MBU3996620.1 hypothetical protein [Gammaproteobacteria bacterium]MBU4081398.1 hypothetical protein [Gammaproteobacteria bacterium]MBU4114177.1 hypothetical protein [Gammaproteobacteria bacterium]